MKKNFNESEFEILYHYFTQIAPMSSELFSELKPFIRKRCYSKGDFILMEGDIETWSNLVIKGVVHQFVYEDGVAVTSNLTAPGLPFNSLHSYIKECPSVEVQQAITAVELFSIKKYDLERLAQSSHQFSYMMYKIHETILLDRENRMFLLQSRSPAKRYKLFYEIVQRANFLLEDTPHKYIASYLNMTPQQFSKLRSTFKKM